MLEIEFRAQTVYNKRLDMSREGAFFSAMASGDPIKVAEHVTKEPLLDEKRIAKICGCMSDALGVILLENVEKGESTERIYLPLGGEDGLAGGPMDIRPSINARVQILSKISGKLALEESLYYHGEIAKRCNDAVITCARTLAKLLEYKYVTAEDAMSQSQSETFVTEHLSNTKRAVMVEFVSSPTTPLNLSSDMSA